jgi:hypothetical protein
MTQSATASTGTVPEQCVEPLPPFSGEVTACIKCSNPEAFTRYRAASPRGLWEVNGVTVTRVPLPERLERSCQRCDFQWDEALDPAPGARPATVQEIAYALQQCAPYPMHPQAAEQAAVRLLDLTHVLVRLDHPVWALGAARPLPAAPAPDGPIHPIPPDPALTVQAPIPLNERYAAPAGPTAFAPGAES